MSVEQVSTIKCNGRDCKESYVDVYPLFVISKGAIENGWEESRSGQFHFCPDCAQKRHEKRVQRSLRIMRGER